MIEAFLNYLKYDLNRASLTLEAYGRDLSQFADWLTGGNQRGADFISVTSSDVRAWIASLAKEGDSPRTIRRKIISLRTFYKWLMKKGELVSSPLRDITLPKLTKPLPDIVRQDEIEESIKRYETSSLEDNPDLLLDKLVIEILYTLGIRRAELIGINDEDISFSDGEIKVTGKRSKQRIIPLPQELLIHIRKYQEYRDSTQDRQSSEHPLLTLKGKRLRPDQINKIVKEALSSSTARKKSPHALRHSFASGMLNGGADMDTVKEFLGHNSLATTQIYTHISLNEIKNIYRTAHPRANSSKNY